jgi:hypothetical protein
MKHTFLITLLILISTSSQVFAQDSIDTKQNENTEENVEKQTTSPTNTEEATTESKDKDYQEENSSSSEKEGIQTNEETQNQKIDSDVSKTNSKAQPLTTKDKTILWAIVIFILVILITRYRYKRKCRNCGKWNAMKKINTECVNEQASSIVEKRQKKDSTGKVISTWEESIPATVYTYHIHRQCKHCGYKDYLEKTKKRKN